LSKQFTAAAVLRLQDQGKLSVDDPLCRWVQPCPEAWRPITLHHLLTHQSGVPDLMTRRDWPKLRFQEWTPAELVAGSARLPLDFEPGTDVTYSNAGYNLLGSVVEAASGRPFAEQLRADLLDPLGMKNTGWDDDTVPLAMGYAKTAEGLGRRPRSAAKVVFASGALYSNLDDMLAWSRALHGGRVLSERSYAQMTAADPARHPVRARWGVPQRFGYGLFSGSPGLRVLPPFADRQLFHSGSWSGFRAHMAHQPDADVHLIVLSNNYDGETPLGFLTSRGMAEALGRAVPTGRLPSDPRPLTQVPEAGPASGAVEPATPAGA
jgi:CubicO group peptidase (beta-lactamase class C family)